MVRSLYVNVSRIWGILRSERSAVWANQVIASTFLMLYCWTKSSADFVMSFLSFVRACSESRGDEYSLSNSRQNRCSIQSPASDKDLKSPTTPPMYFPLSEIRIDVSGGSLANGYL